MSNPYTSFNKSVYVCAASPAGNSLKFKNHCRSDINFTSFNIKHGTVLFRLLDFWHILVLKTQLLYRGCIWKRARSLLQIFFGIGTKEAMTYRYPKPKRTIHYTHNIYILYYTLLWILCNSHGLCSRNSGQGSLSLSHIYIHAGVYNLICELRWVRKPWIKMIIN